MRASDRLRNAAARVGLTTRLMLASAIVWLVGGALVLGAMTAHDAAQLHAEADVRGGTTPGEPRAAAARTAPPWFAAAVGMAPTPAIDRLWDTFTVGARMLAAALAANLLLVYALLRRAAQAFESRVAARTAELTGINARLREESAECSRLVADLTVSEERFRALTAMSSDWFWEQDAELRFVQITEGAHNTGGIPREAHVGKRRWELPYTEIASGDWSEHRAALTRREPFRDLLLRRTVPGDERWVLASGAPRFDTDGRFAGYRGVARDVTDAKNAELAMVAARDAAAAASRAKSEFLANMSHEIRTPMNGLLGMAGLLLDSELPPRERHFARTLQRSAVALLKVINDILDFSKIEAGKLDLDEVDFDLRGLVDETLQTFASAADAKGIELAADTAADLPARVRGDPGRIGQVLANLIGNAIKFTHRGEVVVAVGLDGADAERWRLRFAVRDTGIGIASEVRERIFEPFTQADGSTTRCYGGTGLGLTISRQLVRMMGGTIGVASEPGRGSTFWFTLSAGRSAEPAPAAPAQLAGRRVLVVDDSTTNLEILQHQLAAGGMHACGAADAADALEQLMAAQPPFDLAILDVHMPGLDGLGLAARIRSARRFDALRLVMLSSVGHDLPRDRLAALDVAGWLTKPVGTAALLRALEQALGGDASAPAAPAPDEQQFDGRVLLAEDNEVNRLVAVSLLEAFGLAVDVAADGCEAVAATAERRYDLVLMDCQMPQMDGFAATAAIRRRERGGRRTVIVAVTAHAMEGDRERCLEGGMDDYLAKPFQRADLARLLGRWIARGAELEAMTLSGELE